MIEFAQRLVIGLVAVVVGFVLRELWTALQSRRGSLTGTWEQLIYDDAGQVEKRDIVNCKHYGEEVSGIVRRRSPEADQYKEWRFRGKFRGVLFFGIFWTTDERRNPRSYGTYQLYRSGENLEGFYVRLRTDSSQARFSEVLKPITCEWKPLRTRA